MVLAGVHDELFLPLAKPPRHGSRLDELRAVAHDGDYRHREPRLWLRMFSRWPTSSLEAHSGSRRARSATWPGTSPIRCRVVRAPGTRSTPELFLDSRSERSPGLARLLALLQLDLVHRDDRLYLACGGGEKGLARLAQVVERARALLHVHRGDHALAGDRGEDVLGQRRRAEDALGCDPEDGGGGRLEHPPVRGHEQGLVEAALLREPRGEHVAGVGERLHAVEHAVGRVGHRAQPDRRGQLVERLCQEQAPAAPCNHQPEPSVEGGAAASLEQVGDLGLELRPRHLGQPQARGGTFKPVEMV